MDANLRFQDILGRLHKQHSFGDLRPVGGIQTCAPVAQYVEPTFTFLRNQDAHRVMLVSAAGAVGKTTTARELAARSGCLLWDISKLQLGENSFVGTLSKVLGHGSFSRFLGEISSGRESIIVDGFDEAEIVSGYHRVEIFINELYEQVLGNAGRNDLSFILMSRAETAKSLERTISKINGANEITALVKIDYFDFPSSVKYITTKSKNGCNEDTATAFLVLLGSSFAQVMGGTFNSVDPAKIDGGDQIVRSFIGYSPVLEAIVKSVDTDANAYKSLQEAIKSCTLKSSGQIIEVLLSDIVRRDTDKFRGALVVNGLSGFITAETVYGKTEQMRMLISNFHFKDPYFVIDEKILVGLSDIQKAAFKEMINKFIPNHPFISEGDFAGPAFRDYCLANIFVDESYNDLAKEYIDSATQSVSPMLAICYQATEKAARSDFARYIYDSCLAMVFSSGRQVVEAVFCNGSESDIAMNIEYSEAESGASLFGFGFEFHDEGKGLHLGRKIHDSIIDVTGHLVLGDSNSSVSIVNSAFNCSSLAIQAKDLYIGEPGGEQVAIHVSGEITQSTSLKLVVNGGALIVDGPHITARPPWINYRGIKAKEEVDQDKVRFFLYSLLKWFRKDKRAEFAKHREMIDNIAVSGGTRKKRMLDYLKKLQIIQRQGDFYVFDDQLASNHGISHSIIRNAQITPKFTAFCQDFLAEERRISASGE